MNRRSLLSLLALLSLACAGLFALLGRRAGDPPVEAGVALEHVPPLEASETLLQSQAEGAARSEGSSMHLGPPRTPARDALGENEARVAGWLRPQDDKPWREASVALLECSEGNPPTVLAESRCEPDGGFVLNSDHVGQHLFVVLARGYLPRAQEVELVHGREELLEGFELERGASISGRLSSNAKALARFEVVAIDERELALVKLKSGELLWNGAGFDWRYTTAESGADGRYSISGLRAGSYQVRVSTCRGPMASLCSSDRSPRSARAPGSDVDFGFESSSLALRFTGAGQPLADVDVELAAGGWSAGKRSDTQGVAAFQLVPRLDCTLVARKSGFADLRLPVSAPASGASAVESFEMQPKAPAPELRFLVTSPQGDAPPELRVRLFPALAAAGPEALVPLRDAQLRCTPASAASATKEFVLPDVKPGAYRAVFLPGQPWNNELDPSNYIGTHCAIERTLGVSEDGDMRTSLSADRRPALRLEFKDGAQGYLPARCTLRDEAGAELPIVLVDPAQGLALPGHELSTLGPTLIYSAWCSGKGLVAVDFDGRTLYSGSYEFRPGMISMFGR